MFTRAFTRNLFFRRGQHVVEPVAEKAKQRKSKSKSRSRSPAQTQDTGNVLQPSSHSVLAVDNQQAILTGGESAKGLSAKLSIQDLSTEGHKENENCPEVAPPSADLEQRIALGSCHKVSLASQDVSGSFILLNPSDLETKLGNEDEFPDEVFQTPTMGSDVDESPSHTQVFAVTVTEPSPSDMITEAGGLEISSMPFPLLSAQAQGAPSLAIPGTPTALMPRSLETGLSDITEADEPSMSEEYTKPTEDDSLLLEGGAEACKANLSFSSFGSSYASTPTQSANASLILPEPTPASIPSAHSKAPSEATAEDERVTPSAQSHAREEHVLLHPTLLSSLTPALRSVRGQSRTPVVAPIPTPASVEDLPQTPCAPRAVPTVPAKEDSVQVQKMSSKVLNIPAPATYAEAMNLALQYPEMSSKLLNEPLASACPTPARTASPVRGTARTGPVSPAATPQRSVQMHTADRPNWAVAPEEPKPSQRSRSRGRTRARKPVGARGGDQGAFRSNGASNASKTPPASTPNLSTRPAVSRPASRQQSPQKSEAPQAVEKIPARDFRKEKAEPWHSRVSTWVEKTSGADQGPTEKSDAQVVSPDGSNVNVAAPIALAKAPATDAQKSAAPGPAATARSPLNPNAPAWEYRPHLRAATSSTPGSTTQPSPVVAPCLISPPVCAVPQVSHGPALDLEADLERLRAMLRECGIEERKLSARLSSPGCSVRPMPRQQVQPAVRAEPTKQTLPPGFGQGIHRPFAPTLLDLTGVDGGSARQRTQTHLPVVQSAPWQSSVPQARPMVIPQPGGQIVFSTSKPGANAIPIIIPQTGTPIFALPSSSAPAPVLAQSSQSTTTVALNITPLSTAPAPRAPAFPLSVPPQQPVGTPSPAVSFSGNDKMFLFGQAGKHLGPAVTPGVIAPKAITPAVVPSEVASSSVVAPRASSSGAALLPPGGERSRPPVTGANAIVAPTTRFYGIETPRVVFDKHGWTVNHS